MNKSKFLKKSLAMVLAVMLVVAMIPLSASAADGPITDFTVNGQAATISGTTATVTVSSTTVMIGATSNPGTTVVYKDKDGNAIASTNGKLDADANLATVASKNGNVYTLTAVASVPQEGSDATIDTTYTLNITVDAGAASSDTSIKSVKNVVDASGNKMVSYDINGSKITITMPFGAGEPTLANTDFVTSSTDASVAYSTGEAVVTAQDGSTKTYKVEIAYEKGFTAFSLPGQTKSTIADDGLSVAVNMPYDTDFTDKMVPTFTVGSNIVKVTATSTYADAAVVSGTTKVQFADNTGVAFYLWTSKTRSVTVTVTPETPAANPNAEMTAITVGTAPAASNETEVSGAAVSVEMPANYNFNAAGAKSETVVVKASKNATVSIPSQAVTATESPAGTFTLSGVDISGQSFVVRVAAEDDTDGKYTDYRVNLTKAASAEAKLTDFTIKGTLEGEKVQYSADANGVINVPYALTDIANVLDTFTVYATVSTGAHIEVGGVTINFPSTYAALSAKPNFTDAQEYKVVASDGTAVTYKISLKAAAGRTGKIATAAKLVSQNDNALITDDGTYNVSIKKVNDQNNKSVNVMEVKVPASFADAADYFSTLTLSDGARAYKEDGTQIKALDADTEGAQSVAGITVPTNAYDTTNKTVDTTKAAKVYVLSELKAVGATVDTTYLNTNGTCYYVYGLQAAPETGYAIRSISAPLDENVTVVLSGKNVNITVPYTYDEANNGAAGKTFSLDFTLSSMAKLFTDAGLSNEVIADQANEDKATATKFVVDGATLKVSGGAAVTNLYVQAENGDFNPYNVNVTVAKAETGAAVTALKVGNTTASISGKNINVTLPYGTKLNPLKLNITASKMATVLVNGVAYDANTNYDLNNDVTIKVTSEDGKTSNVYTLKATVSAQFTDVKEGTWYYDYVMQAAAAGIVQGLGNGTFAPNRNVTRRDFALMTVRMLGADTSSYTTSPFKDVEDTDYAKAAIAYCKENGIINGYTDGTFKPGNTITREEAAKILAGALKLTGTTTEKFKDDAKISGWAKTSVYACKAAGIFNGDEKGNFNAKTAITRAETAKVMVESQKVK